MNAPTPDEIRKAAEVLRQFDRPPHIYTCAQANLMEDAAQILDDIANRVERERIKNRMVDKLVDDPGLQLTIRQAHLLIERYPALLES